MKMYFDILGYRDTIKDKDQIMWFFNQMAQNKSKSEATKFWLNLRENYSEKLLKQEAYELLDFIKFNATDAKLKRRKESQKKSKEKAEKEMQNTKLFIEQWKVNRDLIDLIRLN